MTKEQAEKWVRQDCEFLQSENGRAYIEHQIRLSAREIAWKGATASASAVLYE